MRGEMARGEYRQAADAAGRGGDELLRHLDRALALFYAGDPRASNLYFARAEQLADERYTRSLSRAALSLLLNDSVLPYQPDPFERLLVPFYRALNYVSSGQPVDVAVEARRLSALLLERRDRRSDGPAVEGEAFLAYMTGVLFEAAGRLDEARVSYRLAAATDPARWNVAGAGDGSGSAVARAADHGEVEHASTAVPRSGELALILEEGFVTPPVARTLLLFLYEDDLDLGRRDPAALGEELARRYRGARAGHHDGGSRLGYVLPVALPERSPSLEPPAAATAVVDGRTLEVPLAYDVSAAGASAYQEEFAALLAKTVARGLVKTLALKEAVEDEHVVVRVLANAFHVATEKADTRAWTTLPARIRFLRVPLAAGVHRVRLRLSSAGGFRTLDFPDVEIRPGSLTVLTARSY